MAGTHEGDLRGMPAAGKRFSSVRSWFILELEAGKICRASDEWDAATFMRQVYLLPSHSALRRLSTNVLTIGEGSVAAL